MSRDRAAACDCRVTLAEMAQQLGVTTDHLSDRAAHAGYVVRADWAGRPSVTVADAAVLALSMRAGIEGAQRAQGA
jgi:hypothetical protein